MEPDAIVQALLGAARGVVRRRFGARADEAWPMLEPAVRETARELAAAARPVEVRPEPTQPVSVSPPATKPIEAAQKQRLENLLDGRATSGRTWRELARDAQMFSVWFEPSKLSRTKFNRMGNGEQDEWNRKHANEGLKAEYFLVATEKEGVYTPAPKTVFDYALEKYPAKNVEIKYVRSFLEDWAFRRATEKTKEKYADLLAKLEATAKASPISVSPLAQETRDKADTPFALVQGDADPPEGYLPLDPQPVPPNLDRNQFGRWIRDRAGRAPIIPHHLRGGKWEEVSKWVDQRVAEIASQAWMALIRTGGYARLYVYYKPVE